MAVFWTSPPGWRPVTIQARAPSYSDLHPQGTPAILRGSSLPVRIRPYLQGQPILRRRSYRAPVRRRLFRYPTRPAQAAPSLGTRLEDSLVGSGLQAGVSAIPWIGPALAPFAQFAVKPVEAALGAVVSGLGDLIGAFGSPHVLTIADYVAMGRLTGGTDVGIRRGRNM